jgi:hypothetical protein
VANFSIAAVETLDYDFTGFLKEDGKGYCTGKGTIPEPSQKALDEYFQSLSEIMESVPGQGKAVKRVLDIDPEQQKEQLAEIFAAIAKLCSNQPNQEQLMELPPRIKIAFLKWVNQEFQNPEVSSAGTLR